MTPLEKAARAAQAVEDARLQADDFDALATARAALMAVRDSVEDERRSPVGNAIWRARINTILSES